MEVPDVKLNNMFKDETFNVLMDMPVVNDIICKKYYNVIGNEAYSFEEVIQSWKEAPISKYNILWRRHMWGYCC